MMSSTKNQFANILSKIEAVSLAVYKTKVALKKPVRTRSALINLNRSELTIYFNLKLSLRYFLRLTQVLESDRSGGLRF
jgi:hypothetical protein